MLQEIRAVATRAARSAIPAGLALAALAPAAHAEEMPGSFAKIVDDLIPAVVNISTTQEVAGGPQLPVPPPGGGESPAPPGFGGEGSDEDSALEDFFREFFGRNMPQFGPQQVNALGSGFIIDEQGHVVTNSHVVSQATEIQVTLSDERSFEATVVGEDPATDLALLKIEADGPLPTVSWGDSRNTQIGDWVIAIGNSFGLGGTVTTGVLSGRARDIQAGPYDDFLQTDAAINRGNSGGPLFNTSGEVIGVNTVILSPSGGNIGIGFAIPSSTAQIVITQLKEEGRVSRGWLGVQIQPVTEPIAEAMGLEEARGALVAEVIEGGPAEEAGLQTGDVILSFAGQEIDEARQLPRVVANSKVGSQVEMEVLRDGERRTVSATLALRDEAQLSELGRPQPAQPEQATGAVLGMRLAEVPPEARERLDLDDGEAGVLVSDVEPDSVAAENGIRPGDVIVEVAREPVKTPQEAAEKLEAARTDQRKVVLMLMNREGDHLFVALPI